ncbi:MAG: flagellar type III secretion system protein FlhB [Gemmobacter sp.]
MSDDTGAADKEHEPTERKLEEARRKGEVPRGRDLFAAAAFAGLLLAALMAGGPGLMRAAQAGAVLIDQAERLAPLLFSGASAPLGGVLWALALGLGPLFLLPMLAVFGMVVLQRALVFTPDNLKPKLSRISPLQGAKKKFGRSGLFEFAKSFVKLLAVSAVLGVYLSARLPDLMLAPHLGPGIATAMLLELVLGFLAAAAVLQVAIGVLDLLWQRHDHLRRNRMTRKEMMDELKNTEGDPHVKAQRRRRGMDIATNRMLDDVPGADVVIVNPTHYAVALKWNRTGGRAPVCVAKGMDEVAARIRARAAEAGVPVRHDPPTARALHAAVALGEEITPDHYRAVAAAIRFSEAMRAKARAVR